ncbi:MAG: Ig-like domain-containing protein, partial [Rhodoferax sp.]
RFFAFLLALGLSACGGDSDPVACNSGNADVNAILNPDGCPESAPIAGAGLASLTLSLSLTDASGAAMTSVAPGQNGTLQAWVKDSKGSAVPNVAVTFTTSDKTGVFVPTSGTALTDASGVARVGLAAGTQAGAFTVTANAAVGATTALGTASYSVTLPTLTLSALTITPASLSAGGTASLSVTVLNGSSPFTPAQSVIFTSPCAAAGKATISSPVVTVNGVASTSYTDKGCGGADKVTASTSLGGATFTQAGTVAVLAATAGQISFVSALPQNIALKGTGGAGRQESSVVSFKVLDINGNPVSGQLVNFALTTSVGGLTINPIASTTGVDGTVSTVVAAGTINTPVRVTATLAGTSITTLSDQLVVSTGVPDQNSFSLSTAIFNVEGMNHDGCEAPVGSTVRISLADHFNNPVPDGTAVSFTAEGGTVDASCLTGLVSTTLTDGTVIKQKGIPGQCSVRFCVANPRPADGRITILAYALGEESFIDANGDNLFQSGEKFQDLGDPFRNDPAITNLNANANWIVNPYTLALVSPNDIWSTGNESWVAGETFIDTNSNGTWTSLGDGIYNGVLKSPQTFNNQATHVRGALVQVLSTSDAKITSLDPTPTLSYCVDGTPFVNTAKTFGIAARDNNPTVFAGNHANTAPLFLPFDLSGNILPAGTKIEFSTSNGTILSGTSFIVPNTNEPSASAWIYYLTIQSDAIQTGPGTTSNGVTNPSYVCSNPVASGLLTVKVTTPLGLITTQTFSIID